MKKFLLIILTLFVCDFGKVSAQQKSATIEVAVEEKQNILDKGEAKLREIFVPIYQSLEEFRKKQAQNFVVARDKTKVNLGITLTQEATDKLKDFLAPPQAPNPLGTPEEQNSLEVKKLDNPTDYGRLVLFTGLAALFLSVWMFYTVLILLFLGILRLIFRAFL